MIKQFVKLVLPQELLHAISVGYLTYINSKKDFKLQLNNKKVLEEILKRKNIFIELGSGPTKKNGWITVDKESGCDLQLNLNKKFIFPNNSVDLIYSSHLLEHFTYSQLICLLQECYRVLKDDGIFSVAVPNSKKYLDTYYNSENFDVKKYCRYNPAYHYHSDIDNINYIAYMGDKHNLMFDEKNLLSILETVGFKNARNRNFNHKLDLPDRKHQSIYFECTK